MSYDRQKDVIPFIGSDEEVDVVLFITDGKGEPKKVNIRRCIDGDENFSGNAMGYGGSNDEDMRDFLYACTRAPYQTIDFSWDTETDDSGIPLESSFRGSNGFQFCYQLVYKDGYVSAISPFSKIAYPEVTFSMGVNSLSDLTIENVCNLTIPAQGQEVSRVRILFREGNEGVLKFVDEVSVTTNQSQKNWDLASMTYSFRNNEVYGVVSNDVLKKNYDYLPQKANSQTVSGDRLMYGGYTEGFDQVVTNSKATVIFKERITRLIGSEIEVEMTTTLGDEARGADVDNLNNNPHKRQIHSGFKLDFSNMEMGDEGVYDIRVNVKPKKNFHLYSSQSFYGVGFGYFNGSSGTKFPDGIITADALAANGYAGGNNAPKSDQISSVTNVNNTSLGVLGDPGHRAFTMGAQWKPIGPTFYSDEYACGTSPTNPLILKGGLVSFRIAFNLKAGVAANLFPAIVNEILMTGSYTDNTVPGLAAEYVEVLSSPSSGSAPQFDQIVDLGLSPGDSFDADDELAELISHVTRTAGDGANPVGYTGFANEIGGFANYPLAYFIVNRAKYKLQLSPLATDDTGAYPDSGTSPIFSDGTYVSDLENSLFYKFKLADISWPTASEFNGNPFKGEAPTDYYQPSLSQFGNVMTCIPAPIEGLGVQTVVAIDADGKEHIGLPYQGPSYISGGEPGFYDDEDWKKGLIDFSAFAEHDPSTAWPGNNEDYITDHNNWSYHSSPLMPFGLGRVYTQGSLEGLAQFRWPIVKSVSGGNVPNSNIAHPADDGLGVKVDDGTYAQFKTYDSGNEPTADINVNGRIQGGDGPAPIGKWFVYDGPALNGDWVNDFTFTADLTLKRCSDHNGYVYNYVNGQPNNKFSGTFTFRPTHPVDWLPFPFDNNYVPEDPNSPSYISGYGAKWLSKFLNLTIEDNKDKDGTYALSVVDGAIGPGGVSKQSYSDEKVGTYNPGDTVGAEANGTSVPAANRKGSVWNTTLIGVCDNMPFLSVDRQYTLTTDSDFNEDYIAAGSLEDLGTIVSIVTEASGVQGSFKTNDIHNFGIVYYDERGRASSVYRLDNVFVPGYSNEERGGTNATKGAVQIEMELNHPAPPWAKKFRIVYAGPSNTRRFIQTFAGGAYTEVGSKGTKDDKIYISLNYLQSKGISYTKAFGAKDQDTGEPILYRFSEGDKLRVISSFVNDEEVEFHPRNYVFDVIGVEEISEFQENPLLTDEDDYEQVLRRTGSFLVVRNNINATGFDAARVAMGTDRWGDRTLIEIVTPKKSIDEELLPYFETDHFGAVTSVGTHSPSTLTLDSGDVFFRAVPVNTREYIAGEFQDLIQKKENKDEDDSSSRFRGFFMESNSVSDLFRSQAKQYGRVHFVNENASNNYNESGIIFGDKNSAETYRPTITSFPSPSNFLDLPKKYGAIDYLYDTGANIISFQETKVSEIQVNKSITTVAGGGENLALSRAVLNDPRFFSEDIGTSKRPESVLVVNNEFYFVDEDRKRLCRITSGGGLETLSNKKMSNFFEDYFSDIPFLGKAGYSLGYNPRSKEIIISKYSKIAGTSFQPSVFYGNASEDAAGVSYAEGDVFYGVNTENPYNQAGNDSKRNVFPFAPTTLAYSIRGDYWKTFYSFRSQRYEHVDNTFLSVGDLSFVDDLVWIHNDEGSYNSFYGYPFVSTFDSYVNDNPSTSHIYSSVSIDGDSPWNLVMSTSKESTQVTNFSEKEETYYSDIPRTELQGGTSHVKALGKASSFQVDGVEDGKAIVSIGVEGLVDGYTFNTGSLADIYASDGAELKPLGPRLGIALAEAVFSVRSVSGGKVVAVVSGVDPSVLSVQSAQILSAINSGINLFVRSVPRFYGDALRDKFLKIEAIKAPTSDGLISINIDATPSNLDSSM